MTASWPRSPVIPNCCQSPFLPRCGCFAGQGAVPSILKLKCLLKCFAGSVPPRLEPLVCPWHGGTEGWTPSLCTALLTSPASPLAGLLPWAAAWLLSTQKSLLMLVKGHLVLLGGDFPPSLGGDSAYAEAFSKGSVQPKGPCGWALSSSFEPFHIHPDRGVQCL